MRLGLITPNFYPYLDGLERSYYYLARELAKLGHELKLLTSERDSRGRKIKLPSRESIHGYMVIRIKTLHLGIRYEIPLQISRLIKELSGCELVHIVATDRFFNMVIFSLAKLLGKKVLLTVFRPLQGMLHPSKIKALGLILPEMWGLIMIKLCNGIQVKNELDRRMVSKLRHPGRIFLVPDGITEEHITQPRDVLRFRAKYGIHGKLVLFVGRYHPLKGPQLILRAAPRVLSRIPDAKFVLIGSDPDGYGEVLAKISNQLGIRDHVLMLKNVPESHKIEAYDAADVVVIPSIGSHTEAFSIVLSEAWSRNKKVVATDIGVLRERVRGHGILVEPDPESIADGIIAAIQAPGFPVPKVHTWKDVARILDGIYMKL